MTTDNILGVDERKQFVRRAKTLEFVTISYNCLEGIIGIAAGIMAGSIALVGFGLDSLIEVTSASALLWRMSRDSNIRERENAERIALRIVGFCFLALAVYVSYSSVISLLHHSESEKSWIGISLAVISLGVMPYLSWRKRRIAKTIQSEALLADAKQTQLCAYLSLILLVGLVLNGLVGWWWADPVAAMIMIPIMIQEGVEGIKGKSCECMPN